MAARILPVPDPNVSTAPVGTPYERPFATPQGQGAEIGSDLEQAGQVADLFAKDAKARADTAALIGAVGKAKASLNTRILDPENGYSSLRGSDAMAGRQKALDEFNKDLENVSTGLTPDQQRAFAPHALTIQEQAFTHVVQHESVEQERYSQAQFRGNVDQTMVTAENPSVVADPAALRAQYDSLFQTGIEEARRRFGKNAGRDAIASVIVPELQKAAIGTMDAATALSEQGGDPAVAKSAFDEVGKYLVTGHQRQYAARIEAISKKAAVTSLAARIITGSTDMVPVPGGDPIPRVNPGKVEAAIGALDPNDRYTPDVVSAVKQQEDRRAKLWNAGAAQIVQRVYSAGQDPDSGAFDVSSAKISAQDKAWLRGNEPELYGRLYARSQADLRRDVNSPPTAEERRNAVALRIDIADHPEKYASMSEAQFDAQNFDRLHPKDYSSIGNLIGNLQKNVGKMADAAEAKLPDKVDSMLITLGRGTVFPTGKKPPTQWKQDDVDLYMKAREGVLEQARQFVASNAKPPSYADYERFIRSEFVQGTVPHEEPLFPGWDYTFQDKATRVEFEAHPEKYRGTQFVPNIPTDARSSILDAFRRRGVKAPSEAQIRAAYSTIGAQPATPPPAAAPATPVQTGARGQPIPQLDTTQPIIEPGGQP